MYKFWSWLKSLFVRRQPLSAYPFTERSMVIVCSNALLAERRTDVLTPDSELERISVVPIRSVARVDLDEIAYAQWYRQIIDFARANGAENGVDYQASVRARGRKDGKRMYHIEWRALNDSGEDFLTRMASTFGWIAMEPKRIEHGGL